MLCGFLMKQAEMDAMRAAVSELKEMLRMQTQSSNHHGQGPSFRHIRLSPPASSSSSSSSSSSQQALQAIASAAADAADAKAASGSSSSSRIPTPGASRRSSQIRQDNRSEKDFAQVYFDEAKGLDSKEQFGCALIRIWHRYYYIEHFA